MDTLKLGSIIEPGREAHKDATQIAVAPVIAHFILRPGEHVGVTPAALTTYDNPVGVIDPFLRHSVEEGARCWLYLYPGSITALRHEWSHPAFVHDIPPLSEKEAAMKRIAEIASACDMGTHMLMASAEKWLQWGDWTTQQDAESWRDSFPEYVDEFWKLYAVVTGVEAPEDKRENFFSCSC